MVDHPAQYRWPSYAANAQGIDNAIIQLHERYLTLGKIPEKRAKRPVEVYLHQQSMLMNSI